MTDDEELQQLREQTDPGTRLQEGGGEGEADELEDAIVKLLGAVDDGDVSKNLSLRDARLAALIRALEATDDLGDVGVTLQDALGRETDSEEVDRSEVLRLAVRLGLQEAVPEVVETARDAYARHASEQF